MYSTPSTGSSPQKPLRSTRLECLSQVLPIADLGAEQIGIWLHQPDAPYAGPRADGDPIFTTVQIHLFQAGSRRPGACQPHPGWAAWRPMPATPNPPELG